MYDQFYKFLADIIIKFLEETDLRSGAKYDIRLPNKEEVEGLYEVLTQVDVAEPFVYQSEGQGEYKTYCLDLGSTKVILASTAMNVTDAFLTALRNKVGTEEKLFKNTAILFIHDSALDSILNGSESLQKMGMPLHNTSIQKVIETKLKQGDYSNTVKKVLQFVMNQKEGKAIDVRNSLIEYREVLEVLNQGRIDSRQYNEFGLFYDSTLESLNDAEVRERLKENAKYYGMIFNYRQFNIKDSILEKNFTKKNMERIDSKYWNTLDYTELHKWMEKNKSKQPIEYLPRDKKLTEEGLTYWEAVEKDTAAGRRTLNIVVFNPQKLKQIQLKLKFDQTLSSKNYQIVKGSQLEVQASGKHLIVHLEGQENEVTFGRFKYKDVKDYQFKVLVIPVEEKLLMELKSCYKVPAKPAEKGLYIEPIDDVIRLNATGENRKQISLKEQDEIVEWQGQECLEITNEVQDEESDLTRFTLNYRSIKLPVAIKGEAVKPKVISAIKLAKLRRENEQDFTYWYQSEEDSLKLYQDTAQYYAVDELLEHIKMEIQIIEAKAYCFKRDKGGKLEGQALQIPESVVQAYNELINYFKAHQTLPSLCTLTPELIHLMTAYVSAYVEEIEAIEKGAILRSEQRNLSRLGSILNEEDEILWSPLHPINVCYELQRQQQLQKDDVDEQILKKIKPLGLVPYIKDEEGNLYQNKEMNGVTWLKFVRQASEKAQGKYELAKIVEKNIVAFTSHFAYLFEGNRKRPIKINLIGMGEAEVLLGGLLRVIGQKLKKESPEEIIPIEVRLYTNEHSKNIFHELEYDTFNLDGCLEQFDISYDEQNYSLYEFIKIFREKVSVYKLENCNEKYEDCHLSFIGLTGHEEVSYRNSNEIMASSYLGGMINSPTIYKEEAHYVQTIGLKGLNNDLFTRTISAVNAIAYTGMSSTPFEPQAALATIATYSEIGKYKKIYDAATWTIYLEPKVDLSYFTDEQNLLIHYVDRLYSPNMIDAVTLSHKTTTYQKAVKNKMETLGISKTSEDLSSIIRLSNVLNGEWLIELLSSKKSTTIESIHNPLIVRWSTHLLNQQPFIWVPVSLHEFMRTCESVGIKSSKGLFKNKNYERFINDIVWIGYQIEKPSVCFYPVCLRRDEKEAGIFKELNENIYDESFEGRYFRQLLVEGGLLNLEELLRSGLYQDHEAEQFLQEDVKSEFLQGRFEVVTNHIEDLGYEAKVIFSSDEVCEINRSKTGFTVQMNQKLLWENELQLTEDTLEMIQAQGEFRELEKPDIVIPKSESPLDEQVSETSDRANQVAIDAVPVVSTKVILEDWLCIPRYSVVYFFENLPENINEIIGFYLERGIKLFLVMNEDHKVFAEYAGSTMSSYEELIKKQVLSLTYDANIQIEDEEVYIADGEIYDEAFYAQLRRTSFNIEQYEIEHASMDEHLSVRAGAGTGKTKVMIDRIMFFKHMDPTMSLEEIAMITFTNESMMEMRSRLAARLETYYKISQNQKYLKWMDELNGMQISTIHAFSLEVLKLIGDEIGVVNLQIGSYKHRKDRLIEEGIHAYQEEHPQQYLPIRFTPQYQIKNVIKAMSNFLDNRAIMIEEDWGQIDFGTSNGDYHPLFEYVLKYVGTRLQKEKAESGKYEINDLIKMLRHITQIERINSRLRLKYVMVDEYQDTDEVQVEFVGWLCQQLNATLFVVGDIKQSIYRFRGADYTAFEQIEEKLGTPMKHQYITKNYRTNKQLLNELNKFFSKLSQDIENFGFGENSYLEGTKEGKPEDNFYIKRLKDIDSKFAQIRDIYLANKDQGTVCVLTRTNAEVREVVNRLEEMKIPSIAETKGDFYRHPAVRDFYLLVRAFIYTERIEEWILLEQSVYGAGQTSFRDVIKNYVPDQDFLKGLLAESEWYKTYQELARKAQTSRPLQVIRQTIESSKPYLNYARRYFYKLAGENLEQEELLSVAKYQAKEYEANLNHLIFLLQKQFTDQAMSLGAIEEFLKYKILTDMTEDQISLEQEESLQAVKVMTVHKAKGLEFETVILPFTDSKFEKYNQHQFIVSKENESYQLGYHIHLDKEKTCSNSYYDDLHQGESKELVGEETRLLYVACTRAKNKLYAFIQEFANDNRRINSWQDLLVKR